MATYVLPQVQVFQDFRITPTANSNPLRAHIAGGNAFLVRYAETTERELGALGYYDSVDSTSYLWPNRPVGGKVDTSYVKVFMTDALLKYFEDTAGSGKTITKLSGYNNRIKASAFNFASNDEFDRDVLLKDRDVKVGDIAKVRAFPSGGNPVTVWTYVKALVANVTAASIGAGSADASNPSTQSASSSVTRIAGAINCVTLTATHSAYNGLPSGFITETYDIVVLQGSVNTDYTTAKIRIISGSGEDDVAEVTPSAKGVATTIGTRGLTVTFNEADTDACSDSADDFDVSADDLIAGQRWRVTVNDAFTKPAATSGGTYTGTKTTTYVITVTKGGEWAELPQIKVTTTNGIDASGPTTITAASTAFDIGTKGVTASFSGNGLRKGDRYYITATGPSDGAIQTIVLGHNLPVTATAGSEVDLTLYIKKPLLEIPKNRADAAPLTNWDTSETEITINDGITAYDSSWTSAGVPEALDVVAEESKAYGKLYVEYRAWLPTLGNEVNALTDVGDIDVIPGKLHPDNPLKWGVARALLSSNGTEVKYTSVDDPAVLEDWAKVLGLLIGRDDVFDLVPLTRDKDVIDLYIAHVNSMSGPTQGYWRNVWVNLAGIPEIPIVHAGSTVPNHVEATTSDGEVALAVVTDDTLTSGTQYTIVRDTQGTANFITNGVRAGDIVRCLYTDDGFGVESYQEFIVDEVQSEDQIRLVAGPDAPINVAAKIEVWRTLSAEQESEEIRTYAGSFGNRRVRCVWPDKIESSGTVMDGYFLCATLAGLVSGVLPHQGLTRLEITGYTNVDRTTNKFNGTQLDAMTASGVWVVTADRVTGQIYTRHAVTTADYADINLREEMIGRNIDSISFRFKDFLSPYIGISNVTEDTIQIIREQAETLLTVLASEGQTRLLGSRIVSGEIVECRQDLINKDQVILVINLVVPYAMNVIQVRLVV